MAQQRVVGSSERGNDETGRRLKARSQISVMAYFTEPGWHVVFDPFEKRVTVTISDRSYGDTEAGDEDMMELYFHTASTVYDLGVALINASPLLERVSGQTRGPATHPAAQDPSPGAASQP